MGNNSEFQRFLDLLEAGRIKFGNYSRVADQLGVDPAQISQWRHGKHRVPPHTVDALSRLVAPDSYEQKENTGTIIQEAPKAAGRGGKLMGEMKALLGQYFQFSPLISWTSAGNAKAFIDQGYDVEYFPTKCRDEHCYCLKVEGDSMAQKFLDGDIIFVAPSREARNGDLVVVKDKRDEINFKIYHWTNHRSDPVKLTSFNQAYPVIEIPRRELRFIHPVHSALRQLRKDI